ncbi:MAG: hypothetical protein RLZZ58_537 [Pseudomonadota bacterium]
MTHRKPLFALTILFALPFAAGALVAAPPAQWSTVASTTPIGAYQIGNPAAKIQLVEYISYTCSHCAEFSRASAAALKAGYVDKGIVRVEIRNAARDPVDLAAALLARCDGPAKFLGHHNAVLAAQDGWLGTVSKQSETTIAAWNAGSLDVRLGKIAAGSGLGALMKKRGLTQARIDTCLRDATARQQIVSMTNFAWNVEKIDGTPAFVVNGKKAVAAHDWPSLKSHIDQALVPS